MASKSKKSVTNKKLEALIRAQKINELLKIGDVQSQALLDSGEETSPKDESHIAEILNSEVFTRAETKQSSVKKAPKIYRKKTAKTGPKRRMVATKSRKPKHSRRR
jgi:hypothetical protein